MIGSEQPTQESLAEARKWITTWLAIPGVTPCNATAREEDFALLLDREKAKARLVCIHAMCVRCQEGEVAQRVAKEDYISNFGPVVHGEWYHPESTEYDTSYCEAAKIHEAALEQAVSKPTGGDK